MASYAIKNSQADEKCSKCDKYLEKFGIYCHQCKTGMHLNCSACDIQTLVKLKLTRCQFTCEKCLNESFPNVHQTMLELTELITVETLLTEGDPNSGMNKSMQSLLNVKLTIQKETQTEDAMFEDPKTNTQPLHTDPNDIPECSGQNGTHRVTRVQKNNNNNKVCGDFIMKKCKHGRFGREDGVCENKHPKLCFRFLRYGTFPQGCDKGQNCRFYHPKLCYQFNRRKECKRENCPFYHNTLKVTQRSQRNTATHPTNPARRDHEIGGKNFRNRNAANRRDDPPRNAFDRYRNYNINDSTFHGDVDVARGAYDYSPATRVNYFPEHNFLEFQDKIQSQVSNLQHMLETLMGKTDRQPPGAALWKCARPSY